MNRRGLTLIELLVAVICTGIVSYLAWNLIRDEQTNYTRTREKVRLQSDAKEAMRIIEGEMRNLGFNDVLEMDGDRRRVALRSCLDAQDSRIDTANGDFSSFRYVNNVDVPGGDQIEFRMHQASSTGMTDCSSASTPLISVSYRFHEGRLERKFCQGADVATCPANGTWIPFLESVVSFHLQYGVENTSQDLLWGTPDYAVGTNWSTGLASDLSTTTSPLPGDTSIELGGFTTNTKFARFTTALPGHAFGDRYLVSFKVLGSPGWITDGETFGAGFLLNNNTVAQGVDSFPVQAGYPVTGSQGWTVSMVLSPDTSATRYFGFYGRLKDPQIGAPPYSVTIRNLSIRRISRGKYIQWIDAPTVAQKNLVRAVRVSLLVKSRRSDADPAPGTFSALNLGQTGASYTPTGAHVGHSYILMQRIIPVVNNGND